MIDIAVKKDNQHVAVVRFLGWGIFDRYGKARLMDAMELAKCQGMPVVPERSGFEVLSGSLAPEIVDRIWTEMQDSPVAGLQLVPARGLLYIDKYPNRNQVAP
jgi:hypothetical protein